MIIQYPILAKNTSANGRVNLTLSLVFEFSTQTRVTARFGSPRKPSGMSEIFGRDRKIFGNHRKISEKLRTFGGCEDKNLTHDLKKVGRYRND